MNGNQSVSYSSIDKMKLMQISIPLLNWSAVLLFIIASTKPILIVGDYQYYLLSENEEYFQIYNLSPFFLWYFLILILSILAAVISENFNVSSRMITLLIYLILYDLVKQIYEFMGEEYSVEVGQFGSAVYYLFSGALLMLFSLAISLYYSYSKWKMEQIKLKSTDLYPASEID
ncbi:MAG: hypothetical protein ACXAD7_11485 [Candidatus Kariarchaeaceae archaeon]|jgi:hypothetical protein